MKVAGWTFLAIDAFLSKAWKKAHVISLSELSEHSAPRFRGPELERYDYTDSLCYAVKALAPKPLQQPPQPLLQPQAPTDEEIAMIAKTEVTTITTGVTGRAKLVGVNPIPLGSACGATAFTLEVTSCASSESNRFLEDAFKANKHLDVTLELVGTK